MVSGVLHALQAPVRVCPHPAGFSAGAVKGFARPPGTRRTMMLVFFWISSLSSVHSAEGRGGNTDERHAARRVSEHRNTARVCSAVKALQSRVEAWTRRQQP